MVEYVMSLMQDNIEENWEQVYHVLEQSENKYLTHFQDNEEANNVAIYLINQTEKSDKIKEICCYLKAASHILTQSPEANKSVFQKDLISKFQITLVKSIINTDYVTNKVSKKYYESIWSLFSQMIKTRSNQSLLDTCKLHL